MASTNKTSNLGLNSWLGTDHPTRSDFVLDNTLIDNAVGSHHNNSTLHLTSTEKARVTNPISVKQYLGNGSTSYTVNFEFSPKLVIVQKKNAPPVTYTSSGVVINSGVVAPIYGGTQGMSLSSGVLMLSQSAGMIDGAKLNFNEDGATYVVYAFR